MNHPANLDSLPPFILIMRKSVEEGLIPNETTEQFDYKIDTLEGPELEDYLQNLWDTE